MESVMSPILSRLVFFLPFEHQRRPNGGKHALENQGNSAETDRHRVNAQFVQTRDVFEDEAVNRSQPPIGQLPNASGRP